MDCPVCNTSLTPHDIQLPSSEAWESMKVDICEEGCGGIWFENHEFDKVDDPEAAGGEAIVDIASTAPQDVQRTNQHECPSCDNVVMRQYFYSIKKDIEVDECGRCSGVWLDGGEFASIRGLFDSEQKRHQAFEAFFANNMKPKLENRASNAKDSSVNNLFRFLSPVKWFD